MNDIGNPLKQILISDQAGNREPRIGEVHYTAIPKLGFDLPCIGLPYKYSDYPAMNTVPAWVSNNGSWYTRSANITITGLLSTGAIEYDNNVVIAYSYSNADLYISTNMANSFTTLSKNTVFGTNNVKINCVRSDNTGKWMIASSSNNSNTSARLAYSNNSGNTWFIVSTNIAANTNIMEFLEIGRGPGDSWLVVGRPNTTANGLWTWVTNNNGNTWTGPNQLTSTCPSDTSFNRFCNFTGQSVVYLNGQNTWAIFGAYYASANSTFNLNNRINCTLTANGTHNTSSYFFNTSSYNFVFPKYGQFVEFKNTGRVIYSICSASSDENIEARLQTTQNNGVTEYFGTNSFYPKNAGIPIGKFMKIGRQWFIQGNTVFYTSFEYTEIQSTVSENSDSISNSNEIISMAINPNSLVFNNTTHIIVLSNTTNKFTFDISRNITDFPTPYSNNVFAGSFGAGNFSNKIENSRFLWIRAK
jgi:hypothetical protein